MKTLKKSKQGYGYKYTELAQINEYCEEVGISYYQYIERIENDDYIMTVVIDSVGNEQPARRGCRVVQATLQGIENPAQEQGSALTYARRYSLLMVLGLATEDDDAQSLSVKKEMKATQKQVELIKNLNIDLVAMLNYYKVGKIEDLSIEQASEIIKKKGGK